MNFSQSISRSLGGLLTAGTIVLCAGVLLAQTALPPINDIEKERKTKKVELSPEARELGQEYLEILRDLKELTADYAEYLAELKTEKVARQEAELRRLAERLARGKYLSNIGELSTDLERLQVELNAQADSMRGQDRRASTITNSLSLSLSAVRTALQATVAHRQQAEQEFARQLQMVVEQSEHGIVIDSDKLRKLCVLLRCNDSTLNIVVPDFDFDFNFTFDTNWVHWTGEHKPRTVYVNLDSMEIPEPGSQPKAFISVPNVPDVPSPPPNIGTRNIVYSGRGGATRIIKEFSDSLEVRSDRTVIVVSSPIGDIRVTGWDRHLVSVNSEVQVSADQQSKANALAEKVGVVLRTSKNRDSIYIECTVPNLHDPAVNIDNDIIEVRLPKANPVWATTAFGSVDISDMRGSVALNASHGEAVVDDIRGDVAVTANLGEVNISNIRGNLSVTNSHGSIGVEDVTGSMDVRNRFASITIDNCRGAATIDNTGPVEITSHIGDVRVTNRNGTVKILHSEGDYVVDNSMQMVTVEYIDGSVDLGNIRGPIKVSDITGTAKATNKAGSINASYLAGPIDLSNSRGTTMLILNRDFTGPSIIHSDFGVIRLSLSPDTDVLVKAKTDGGDIQSSWPVSIATAGSVKSTELTLGRGKNQLTLTGDRATIILSDDK